MKRMNSDDIKQIGDLVEQKIQSALKPIHKKLDEHSAKLDSHTAKLDEHSAKLDAHTAKLDNHTASLVTIEDTLKGYGDMYKVNKDESNELNERVTVIEDHLGLTPAK